MRANWHQNVAPAADLGGVDPFDSPNFASTDTINNTVDAVAPATTTRSLPPMKPISLETPEPELHDYLGSLTRREARLFDAGITCDLKDQDDMSCLGCPLNEAENDDEPMAALCRIGMAQEVTCAHLLAQRASGG